jgi:hypothetical protein
MPVSDNEPTIAFVPLKDRPSSTSGRRQWRAARKNTRRNGCWPKPGLVAALSDSSSKSGKSGRGNWINNPILPRETRACRADSSFNDLRIALSSR